MQIKGNVDRFEANHKLSDILKLGRARSYTMRWQNIMNSCQACIMVDRQHFQYLLNITCFDFKIHRFLLCLYFLHCFLFVTNFSFETLRSFQL